MADLVELDVVVRDKGLKQSISTVSRLERELTKAAKAVEDNRISQDRYNKILLSAKREYEALGLSSQKATSAVRRFANEQRKLASATDMVQREIQQSTVANNAHTKSVQSSANALNLQTQAAQRGSKGLKHFASIGLQQVGYQVSDFTVQVQGGTSALVAFGQQGSQLAGLLFLLPGMFGAIAGAVTSIAIPAFTAFGNVLFNLGGKAEEVKGAIEDLDGAFNDLDNSNVLNYFGQINSKVDNSIQRFRGLLELQQKSAQQERVEAFGKLVSNFAPSSEIAQLDVQIGRLEELAQEAGTGDNERLQNMRNTLSQLVRTRGELLKIQGDTREETAANLSQVRETLVAQGLMTPELRIQLATLADQLGLYRAASQAVEETADAAEKTSQALQRQVTHQMQIATMQQEVNAGVEAILAARDVELQKQQDRIRLTQLEIQYGKDSVEYLRAQQEINERIYRAVLEEQNIRGNIADEIIESWKQANQLEASQQVISGTATALNTLWANVRDRITEGVNATGEMANRASDVMRILSGKSGVGREDPVVLDPRDPRYDPIAAEMARVREETGIYKPPSIDGSGGGGGVEQIEQLRQAYEQLRASVDETYASEQKLQEALETLNKAKDAGIIKSKEYQKVLELIREEYGKVEKGAKSLGEIAGQALEEAYIKGEEYNDLLKNEMVQGVESVSSAFTDFIMSGLRNFEDFGEAIKASFRNLIATLIQTAVQNQIVIPIVASVTGGGGLLGGGGGGGLLGNLTGGGGGLLGTIGGGIASVGSNLVTGGSAVAGGFLQGLGGVVGQGIGGLGTSFGSLGGILSGSAGIGGGSLASAIGAAIPAVGAIFAGVTLIAGLFKKKTKLIDQGLDIAINETEAFVETFQKFQTKSLFGGSSYSRTTAPTPAETADPIVANINDIQSSIMEAASTMGIASSEFDNFTYNFSLSLKGLSEEEQIQKINEGLSKMGDEFASFSGHFETMNELMEAASQRYELNTRLLQLQGNEEELLRRQREQETAVVHDLNKATLQRVYALEDARTAMDKGLQSLQAAFQAQQQNIQNSANAEIERLQDQAALQIKTIENDAEERANAIGETVGGVLEASLSAAQEALGRSSGIYDMLSGALRDRLTSEQSDQQFSALRRQALGFLSSISDVSGVDVDRLEDALGVLSEPSEQLFSNFVDYARDFNRTTGIISNLTDTAETQLSADEQAVNLLEEQLEQQRSIRDSSRDQIREIQEGVRNQIDTIRDSASDQIAVLQSQYDMAVSQYNAALGIDDSVKSVGEAIKSLTDAIEMFNSANAQASNSADAPASSGNTIGQKILEEIGQYGGSVDSSGKIYKSVNATTQSKLLEAAKLAGIETSGKTGIQIAQEIANVAGVGLKITESLSQKQFAVGGFHTGGMRIVGERGPELEMTGPSRIYSNRQTSEMFRDPELANEVRGLRGEVAGLRAENAQLQANNNKYTKRSYDLYRKWDVEGIPAERA